MMDGEMETQKPPTIENRRLSKLAVIAFIPGSIVGVMISELLIVSAKKPLSKEVKALIERAEPQPATCIVGGPSNER